MVSALRVARIGLPVELKPAMSLTSVRTRRLIRPGESTTGVKASCTPKRLKATLAVPVLASTPVMKGTSPPARKSAVSPETAVRVGSASVRIMLVSSSARMVAWMSKSPEVNEIPTFPGWKFAPTPAPMGLNPVGLLILKSGVV